MATHIGIARDKIQHDHIFGQRRAGEALLLGQTLQRGLQSLNGGKIKLRIAPLKQRHRIEAVLLQHFNELFIERRAAPGRAECAIANMATRTPRNLRHLGRLEAAILPAVIFAIACKGDVINIEIEAHADRIGRNNIIDFTVLIELDLRIARARAERPQHNRRTATCTTNEFGNGVNFFCRESDNRRATWQTREFALSCKG